MRNPVRTTCRYSVRGIVPTFHDRYRAGEHQQVWSELVSLGEAVRQEPTYADAVAVARETMRRARTNIETLINRLHALGYRFDTEQTAAQQSLERIAALAKQVDAFRANAQGPFAGMMKGLLDRVATAQSPQAVERLKATAAQSATHPLEDRSVYSRASKDSAKQIDDAERHLRGPLPVSLRAWYETVDHVSFLGSHPALNPASAAPARPVMYVAPSMLQGPGAQQRQQLAESLGFAVTSETPERSRDENALPDPFVVAPLEEVLGDGEADEAGSGSFIISPDDLQKANISGDAYYVDLPDRNADVVFQDWESGYFVTYLRRVFAWGGFPGWARHRNPPIKLIQELAHDLEPL